MNKPAVRLMFLPPTPPLSENQSRRLYWSVRRKRLKPWHDAALDEAWHQRAVLVNYGPANVRMAIPFPQQRRRDPHNYVGTVVKACIDGLVGAMVWPDDTAEFVTVIEPVLYVARMAVIDIAPRKDNPHGSHL